MDGHGKEQAGAAGFHAGILPGDLSMAKTAFSFQQKKGEERDVVLPGNGVLAMGAEGARPDQGKVFGEPVKIDVGKGSQGRSRQEKVEG